MLPACPPALLAAADHSLVAGPSEHFTLVFNTFVFMQASTAAKQQHTTPAKFTSRSKTALRSSNTACAFHPLTPHRPKTLHPPCPALPRPVPPRPAPSRPAWLQLFNHLNARKILDSSGAWEGLAGAKIFQAILAGELLMQVAIVQVRGLVAPGCPAVVLLCCCGQVKGRGWREATGQACLAAHQSCCHSPGAFAAPTESRFPAAAAAAFPPPLQFGGPWFNTHPLDGREWAVCVGLGATTLGLRELLRRLPYGR